MGARLGQNVDRLIEGSQAARKAWAAELEARTRDEAATLPRAEIRTARGRIVVELLEDDAPEAVAWFVQLAEAKAFDGQPYLGLRDTEVRPDGPEAKRRHWRGSLSLAPPSREGAGPQFFLAPKPMPEYDGRCSVFGRVLEGQDVAEAMKPGERLESVRITRKRDHPYEVKEPPKPEPPGP